jgi:type IV secretory pathway VirB10-like protein
MSRVAVITTILVLAAGLFAQEEGRPPYDEQPPVAPPTYPEDMDPGVRPVPPNMPPDTSAPPPRKLSSAEAEEQIQLKLDAEPSLRNNQLEVEVTDDEVVVSGTADSEAERDVAIRIAESYAGERPVNDKIVVKART